MAPDCARSWAASWLLTRDGTTCLAFLICNMSKAVRNQLSPRDMLKFSGHESVFKG